MKKFRLLLMAIICTVSVSLSSCDIIKDAWENDITDTWVTSFSEGSPGWTVYQIYEFDYSGIFSFNQFCTNDYTGAVDSSYTIELWGTYDFSNYREELILYIDYPYSRTEVYDAKVSKNILYIYELYTDGYYYPSEYYRD